MARPFSLSALLVIAACGSGDKNSSSTTPPITPPASIADGGASTAPADAPPPPGIDYLIVSADTLTASADHFKTYRESTAGGGSHKVLVKTVSSLVSGEKQAAAAAGKISDYIKALYAVRDASKPFFVLLLGDATEGATFAPGDVPVAHYVDKSDVNPVTTDNEYADVDGDHMPDLAVGRIPVANDAEADAILDRTKTYESTYETGLWNRRLSLFASTSGFGEPADSTIEGFVFKMVEELPYDFDLTLTYAKQTSPYVYVPEHFSDKVYERLNEGSLMMAYVGHGDTSGFATLDWGSGSFPIFDTSKLAAINIAHKAPILTLIACLTGRFTVGDSVSELLLKSAHGPLAVLSSTEISNPYPNAIFIREISQSLAATSPIIPTIGELFLSAKRRSILNSSDPLRQEIDQQVDPLIPAEMRETLKRTHLYMYTLFGDPAAKVAYPHRTADVALSAATAKVGADITVNGTMTGLGNGSATVTLESTRSVIAGVIKPVPADGDATRDGIITDNYTTANNRAVATQTVSHANGKLTATITVPAATPAGTYYVKLYADDGKTDAIGSKTITITAN